MAEIASAAIIGMDPRNEQELRRRVIDAGSRAVKEKGWVSSIDVLVGLGWLTPKNVGDWRRGQVPFLERVVTAGLGRVSTAMRLFHEWSAQQGWTPSRTEFGSAHRPLRFSKSGQPNIEDRYRTHWVTRAVVQVAHEKKRRERQADGRERARLRPRSRRDWRDGHAFVVVFEHLLRAGHEVSIRKRKEHDVSGLPLRLDALNVEGSGSSATWNDHGRRGLSPHEGGA